MKALFTRAGNPAPTATHLDETGRPYCEMDVVCPLCGGSGYTRWKSDPLCMACDGNGLSTRKDRIKLFTAEEIEALKAADAAKERRRMAERAQRHEALMGEHGSLIAKAEEIQDTVPFIASILDTAQRTGRLSEAQCQALKRAMAEHHAGALTVHVGAIGEHLSSTVTVKNVVPFKPKFRGRRSKPMAAITMADTAGNELVAFSAESFKMGQALQISATIKEHRVWRGTRQTVLEKIAVTAA